MSKPLIRIYKTCSDGRELEIHLFYPEGFRPDRDVPRPAAVSVHGGGWTLGPVDWGYADAELLAKRGFVGLAVDYRLAEKGSVCISDCQKDVNDAVAWTQLHAGELGIDPQKILAVGHSAGGHMVLSAALFPEIGGETDFPAGSSVPNAVVALSPVLTLTGINPFRQYLNSSVPPKKLSPLHSDGVGNVPLYVFQGESDEVLSLKQARLFEKRMAAKGSSVRLYTLPKGRHNLYYDDPAGKKWYHSHLDDILRQLNWI